MLVKTIIVMAAAIFTALFIVEVVGFGMKIKKLFNINPSERMRPFDCPQCLAAWFGIGLYFLPLSVSIALACMFGSAWLIKYFK